MVDPASAGQATAAPVVPALSVQSAFSLRRVRNCFSQRVLITPDVTPIASFRLVSDITPTSTHYTHIKKRVNDGAFALYRQKVLTRFFAAMPIRPYLDGHRFDAETTRLMGIAFETALAALHTKADVDPPRDLIARIIIDLAKTGERDPERLCEAALNGLPADHIVNAPNPLAPHASPPVLPES